MRTRLLTHYVQTLRLRLDAPFRRDWRHFLTLRRIT